jgi:hypothetical protein
MTKKELQNRRAEIVRDLTQRCETIRTENRNFTPEEQEEIRSLEDEKATIEVALRNYDNRREIAITDAVSDAAQAIRSVAKHEADGVEINLRAIAGATTTVTAAGAAAESTVGVVEPLEKGMILEQIGAQIRTDLPRGGKWAVVAPAQATFENEATELSAQAINVTKKATTPHRIGVKVFVSNQALNMSDFDLMNRVVMPEVQKAIRRELNAWMFAPVAYNSTHNASGAVATAATKATFKGAIPTAAELAQLRGKVKAKGVYDDGTYRYVMSSLMAAELSVTPVATGSTRMILEDGKIAGVPVYETEYIEHGNTAIDTKGAKYVAFGRWSDAVVAQFGAARVVVDSTSAAAGSADGTYVIVNVDYDMVSLYDGKSFGLGTATIA